MDNGLPLTAYSNGDYYVVFIYRSKQLDSWNELTVTTGRLFRGLLHISSIFPSRLINFTYTANANTVNFTNTTTDFDSLVWDFGDGIAARFWIGSCLQFNGTYNVVLTAYNECGFHQQSQSSFSITLTGISK